MGLVSALGNFQFGDGNSMKSNGYDEFYDIGMHKVWGRKGRTKLKLIF